MSGFETVKEQKAYRKENSKSTSLDFGMDDAAVGEGKAGLVKRKEMMTSMAKMQEEGNLRYTDNGYYIKNDTEGLAKSDLFKNTLSTVVNYNATIAEQKAEKAKAEKREQAKASTQAVTDPTSTGTTLVPEPAGPKGDFMDQFMKYYDSADDNTKMHLVASGIDLASVPLGMLPGLSVVSAIAGAGATTLHGIADWQSGDKWGAVKGMAMGYSLDALSVFGGKGLKAMDSVGKVGPWLKGAVPLLKTALVGGGIYAGMDAASKFKYQDILNRDISSWDASDYANVVALVQFVSAGAKGAARKTVNAVGGANKKFSSNFGGMEMQRGAVGKGKALVARGADNVSGAFAGQEARNFNKFDHVMSRIGGKASNLDIQKGQKMSLDADNIYKEAKLNRKNANSNLKKASQLEIEATNKAKKAWVGKSSDFDPDAQVGKNVKVAKLDPKYKEAPGVRPPLAEPARVQTPAKPTPLIDPVKKLKPKSKGKAKPKAKRGPAPKKGDQLDLFDSPGKKTRRGKGFGKRQGPKPEPKSKPKFIHGPENKPKVTSPSSKIKLKAKPKSKSKPKSFVKKFKSLENTKNTELKEIKKSTLEAKKNVASANKKLSDAEIKRNDAKRYKSDLDNNKDFNEAESYGTVEKKRAEYNNTKRSYENDLTDLKQEKKRLKRSAALGKNSSSKRVPKKIADVQKEIDKMNKKMKKDLSSREAGLNKEKNSAKKYYRTPRNLAKKAYNKVYVDGINKLSGKLSIGDSDYRFLKEWERKDPQLFINAKKDEKAGKKLLSRAAAQLAHQKEQAALDLKKRKMKKEKKENGGKLIARHRNGGRFIQKFQDGAGKDKVKEIDIVKNLSDREMNILIDNYYTALNPTDEGTWGGYFEGGVNEEKLKEALTQIELLSNEDYNKFNKIYVDKHNVSPSNAAKKELSTMGYSTDSDNEIKKNIDLIFKGGHSVKKDAIRKTPYNSKKWGKKSNIQGEDNEIKKRIENGEVVMIPNENAGNSFWNDDDNEMIVAKICPDGTVSRNGKCDDTPNKDEGDCPEGQYKHQNGSCVEIEKKEEKKEEKKGGGKGDGKDCVKKDCPAPAVWDEKECKCTTPISETVEAKMKTCDDGSEIPEDQECPKKEEKKEPWKMKELEGDIKYKNKSSFMDKVGGSLSRINVGDIYNLVDMMKKPEEFTAAFNPMQATTLSKRKVQNMAGFEEMKSQASKPAYNVKTSDLMAKSQLQRRNQQLTNQTMNSLYAQNAQHVENQKNANLDVDNQNRTNLTQTRNMNNQQLNQRNLMDAQGRAQQATALSKRKAQVWGSIGNRLQSGVEESLVDRSYDKLAEQSHIMGKYSNMKNDRLQEILTARNEEKAGLQDKYKSLTDEEKKEISLTDYVKNNKDTSAYYNKSDDDITNDFNSEFQTKYKVDPTSEDFEANYLNLQNSYKKKMNRYSKDPKNA